VKTPSRLSCLPLPRRPLEWGLAIVAVALVAIAVTSLGTGSSSSSAATKRTATVGKGVVQSTVSGNGTLEPAQKVKLSFGASGEVTAIDVKSGEKVKVGQVLAEVDSSSARASLASAEAQLIEAEEAVEAAEEAEAEEAETEETAYTGGATMELVDLTSEATASAVTEGTAPVEGEATSTEAEGDAAAELEAAKAEAAKLAKEKKELEKRAEEEAAKAKRESAKAETPAAEEASSSTEGSDESSAGAATTAASGGESTSSGGGESTSGGASGGSSVSLPTAEANLREAELSVKSARQEVRETTLRAPISGTMASIAGAVGETVSGGSAGGGTSEASAGAAPGGESTGSGSAFMVIAQLHRLKMEVSFSESDIGKVRKGQTATVAIDSMEGTELSGEVTKLSVLPSEGSSSVVEYPATILLSQSAKGLRAGMSASAEVVVEQVKNAITVPSEAISAMGGKSVTVEEDGKEVTKTITTGLEGDETTEVVSGLKAGETLVLPEVTVATASSSGGTESTEGVTSGAFPGGAGGFTGGPPSVFGGGAR
jgi:multidrug efflux pump subunit AcrA (membrane-fusion protein)